MKYLARQIDEEEEEEQNKAGKSKQFHIWKYRKLMWKGSRMQQSNRER